MAISHVASRTAGGNTAGLSMVLPTVINNDIALIVWTMSITVSPSAAPTGFSLYTNNDRTGGTNPRSYVYRRTLSAADSGTNVALNITALTRQSATMVIYRGLDTSAPINAFSFRSETISGSTHACPAVTPTAADCSIATAISERISSGTTDYTPPSGYTDRADTLLLANGSGGTITAFADDGLVTTRNSGTAYTPPVWTSANVIAGTAVTIYSFALKAGAVSFITNRSVAVGSTWVDTQRNYASGSAWL